MAGDTEMDTKEKRLLEYASKRAQSALKVKLDQINRDTRTTITELERKKRWFEIKYKKYLPVDQTDHRHYQKVQENVLQKQSMMRHKKQLVKRNNFRVMDISTFPDVPQLSVESAAKISNTTDLEVYKILLPLAQ